MHRGGVAFAVVLMLASVPAASATDFYWDTNGTTANGDGGANTWANTLGRISTNASGTVATANWSNTSNSLKSMQFGFGPAPGNATSGGLVGIGSSGSSTANSVSVGTLVLNASGTVPYTFQNNSTSLAQSLTLNTGGADVTAGYGIVVNSNVVGDTTFQQNAGGGSFQVNLGANQTWQNNSSTYALIMNVPVTGTAYSLTTNGVGTIVLNGSNSMGSVTVGVGTLRATNANALGGGAVTVSSSATLDIRAAITKNIANSGTVSIAAGGNLSAGSLGGALSLGGVSGTVATFTSTLGSGTLSLASLATSGNTNISLAAGSQLAASGVINFTGSGNLVTLTGAAASPGVYTLIAGSSLSGTSGLSLTGGAVGSQTIALGSSGILGRNTYAFGASGAALQLSVTGTVFNDFWNGGASGIWNTSTANWQKDGAGSNIAFVDNDNVTLGSAAAIAVPANVAAGTLAISNASGSVDLTGAGGVTAASLSKSGAGAATIANGLTVNNTGITVSAGSLATSGVVSVNAGGISVNGGSFTSGSTTTVTAGGLTLAANTTFTGNGATTITAGGLIVGSGATYSGNGATTVSANGLTVNGGTATLGAAGTIAGGVAVNGGRLELNAAQAVSGAVSVSNGGVLALNSGTLGTGALTLDNGTLTEGVSVTGIANTLAIGLGGGTVSNDSAFTLSGAITGSSNVLTKTGTGALTISNAMGASKAGVQVNVSAGSLVLSGNSVKEFNGTSVFNGNVTINSSTVTLSTSGNFGGTGTIAMTGVSTINVRNGSTGGSKAITNPVSLDGTASLVGTSGGNLSLSGVLSGSGAVTTSGNAKISLSSTTAGGFAGTLTVNNSGASGYTEINTIAVDNATGIVINRGTNDVDLQIANTAQDELAAVISGAGILSISAGTNRAILSGNNTFSGGASLKGDVGIKSGSGLGTGVITAAASGARVFWDGALSSGTIANALSTGTSSSYVLAFAPGAGKTVVLTGSAGGAGQLKVSGSGDLDLSQLMANTTSGGIEIGTGRILTNLTNLGSGAINFGTGSNSYLVATTSGTLSTPITIGSASGNGYTANFDTNGNAVTVNSAINNKAGNANGGLLTKIGAGLLTLSASNGYTGVTTVTAGTLVAGNVNAFGAGAVNVNAGTLDLGGLAVANVINLNGGSLVNAAGYAGTQTLNALVSYASGTVGGTVNVASGGVLKGSGVAFNGPVSIGDGGIHAPGNSPGTQAFANGLAYSGSSTLQWELAANTDSLGAAGTSYDVLNVTGGDLAITSNALLQMVFNAAGSTVNWNDAFWDTNHSWTVIGYAGGGSSIGNFALAGDATSWLDKNSISLASVMAANNRTVSNFSVDNLTGSVVLSYSTVVVPEPASIVLVAFGAGGLLMAAWRRNLA